MTPSLGAITSPDAAGADIVLVPVGSLEQHGPHLPLNTDTVIASALAGRLAELVAGSVVAPAIAYGSSGEHQSFAGTSSIGNDALHHLIVELTRSMRTWSRRVLFVNGHGGNVRALSAAVRQLAKEGHDVSWVSGAVPGSDAHAGRTETSLMLHLHPGAVRLDRASVGNTAPLSELMPRLVAEGLRPLTPNGVLGDPGGASAAEGAVLLDAMVARALAAIDHVAA